jgi:hypothetical protein
MELRRNSIALHLTTTLFVGAFAAYVAATDWNFTRRARVTTARLVTNGFHYRSGQTLADAVYVADGVLV